MKLGSTNFKFERESWEVDALYENNVVAKVSGAYTRACDAMRDADLRANAGKCGNARSLLVCKTTVREVCRIDVPKHPKDMFPLDCPYCEKAVVVNHCTDGCYAVECRSCSYSSAHIATREGAIARHNEMYRKVKGE